MMFSRARQRIGQAGTEYMLVLSVLTIAVVAGAFVFVPTFQNGTMSLAHDISTILDTHQIAGMGVGGGGNNGGGANNGVANNGGGNNGGGANNGGANNGNGANGNAVNGGGLNGGNGGNGNGNSPGANRNGEGAEFGGSDTLTLAALGTRIGGTDMSGSEWWNAAKSTGLTDGQICSQYAIWLHIPGTLRDTVAETVDAGLTQTQQVTIPRFSIFGWSPFGERTVEVTQGQMNLRGMQQYLRQNGQDSQFRRDQSINDLGSMVDGGHSPVVILATRPGDPTSGHTVTVVGVETVNGRQVVMVKDQRGIYEIPASTFNESWNGKALDIPKPPYFQSSDQSVVQARVGGGN